ncbi:uncharacterized protein MONBRDRAFT_33805 [Monosiga brevicollis MX1]|uniref:LamG-like jellyroll fold domain-containing protein n=1 Tax=Monosiga brevicollis TaxID=81824 RepID=A9V7L7_MONBE|nr:uncharacterized protein MONBRDRAFT_33805 [Monosiga brevicollis MX1]EDQ86540.1 predicted protein [Monosiga brevicollis MX1]|eukprot:XP_001748653.1 hypothetical protein [Monosiga brevicollis MX1]
MAVLRLTVVALAALLMAAPSLAVDCTGHYEVPDGNDGCRCQSGFAYKNGHCAIVNEIVTEENKIVLKAEGVVLRAPNDAMTNVADTNLGDTLSSLSSSAADSASRLSVIEAAYVNIGTVRELEALLGNLSDASESFVDEALLASLIPRLATNEMEDVVCQNTSDLRTIRYHLFGRHLEYCAQWKNTFYWHQLGLPDKCRYGNSSSGVCHRCIDGYVTARGGTLCTMQGNVLHLAFDNNLYDQSWLGRDARFYGVANDYTFGDNVFASADGTPFLKLNGNGEHVRVEPMTFGGDLSICVDVYYENFLTWSRVMDFSAGGEGGTQTGSDSNILLANVGGSSDMKFAVQNGGQQIFAMELENFLDAAYHKWAHVCITADGGTYTAYLNGEVVSIQTGPPIPWVRRSSNYIGRSNWQGNAHFKGNMDNLRIFSRALTADDVAEIASEVIFPPPLDEGLFARYRFEGNTLDSSGNGNDAVAENHLPFNAYQRRAPEGEYAMQFDGTDDYVTMPAISFDDSALSFCFHIRWYDLDSWSRVIDIHNSGSDGVLLTHIDTGENLQFAVKIPSQPQATLEVTSGWAYARGAYQHYCATMNNTEMALYRQGRLVTTVSNVTPLGTPTYANAYIGRSAYSSDATLGAELDDVQIYRRALPLEDVQLAMCDGKAALDCVGLLGHWTFDYSLRDNSNNQWNGELVAADQEEVTHFVSDDAIEGTHALNFVGNNSYVQLPPRRLFGESDLSFCVWVKFGSNNYWERIFDFGSTYGSQRIYMSRVGNDNTILLDVHKNGGNTDVRADLPNSTDYTHVCATIDSAGGHMYINGELAQETPGVPKLDLLNSNLNYIGRSYYDQDASTDAKMDDFRIYGYALSATEVSTLYNMYAN